MVSGHFRWRERRLQADIVCGPFCKRCAACMACQGDQECDTPDTCHIWQVAGLRVELDGTPEGATS